MQALTAIGASIVLGCWLHLWYIKVWYPEYEGAHYVHNVTTVDSYYVPEGYPPLRYPSMWIVRTTPYMLSELSCSTVELNKYTIHKRQIPPPLGYWDHVIAEASKWTVQNGKHLALVA